MLLRPARREKLPRLQERAPALAKADDGDTSPTLDLADPEMTRAARAERAAWRRAHRAAWWRELEALYHFDPVFIYDPGHEYDQESTTDPDYDAEGLHFLEYDEDGVVSPLEKRARKVQERGADTASAMLADQDLEGDYERLIRFRPETVRRANRASGDNHPEGKGVRPDMLVRAAMSVSEREQFMPDGVLRLDLGAPVPPLVLEVVSAGSAHRDLHYKMHLYAAARVAEYLVYDLGGKRLAGSPRELLMFRLQGENYQQDPVAGEYWSDVFGTRVRFQSDARERDQESYGVPEEERSPPRFQWWDGEQKRWRDPETDAEHEQTEKDVALLHLSLSEVLSSAILGRIEAAWHRHGAPANLLRRIEAVRQTPSEWSSLLPGKLEDGSEPSGPPLGAL